MTRDLGAELKAAYDHASMRALAKHLKTAPEWKAVQEVSKRHDEARQYAAKEYRQTYDRRVAAERQSLLQKRGQNRAEISGPVATDRFNKSSLERQAHRNVRNAHQRELAAINASETKELKALTERAGIKPESSGPRNEHKQSQSYRSAPSTRLKHHF